MIQATIITATLRTSLRRTSSSVVAATRVDRVRGNSSSSLNFKDFKQPGTTGHSSSRGAAAGCDCCEDEP
jgi:hypothetical protein